MTSLATDTSTAADRASALAAENRRRRKLRRIAIWVGAPLFLAVLLFSSKVLSMYAFAHFTITAHKSLDSESTVRNAKFLEPFNVFEPFVAPYNEGVGLATGGHLPEARAKFDEALKLAQGTYKCAVIVNRSLVIEAQGDAAASDNKPTEALGFYADAQEASEQLVENSCFSEEAKKDSPDPNRDMKDENKDNQERQQGKEQQQQQKEQEQTNPGDQEPGDQGSPKPSDQGDPGDQGGADGKKEEQPSGPGQEKLEKLREKLEEGQGDRQDSERNKGDRSGQNSGPGVDKPW